MRWTDGSVYRGEWQRGIQNGKGVMVFPNGKTKTGIFKNNVFTEEIKEEDVEESQDLSEQEQARAERAVNKDMPLLSTPSESQGSQEHNRGTRKMHRIFSEPTLHSEKTSTGGSVYSANKLSARVDSSNTAFGVSPRDPSDQAMFPSIRRSSGADKKDALKNFSASAKSSA